MYGLIRSKKETSTYILEIKVEDIESEEMLKIIEVLLKTELELKNAQKLSMKGVDLEI